jgi:hypothetical protein
VAALRHGNLDRLTDVHRKSLSAFSFAGAAGAFFLSPTLSDRILSCIYEQDGGIASQPSASGAIDFSLWLRFYRDGRGGASINLDLQRP